MIISIQVLVTPHGEVDATRYLDPATGKVLVFDHAEQVISQLLF